MKEKLFQKLTSRKFWLAITGFITPILLTFGVAESTVAQVTGFIMAGASVIAYIIGEGLVDSARAAAAGTDPDPEPEPEREIVPVIQPPRGDLERFLHWARGWIGANEYDGSHEEIIDVYNTYLPHPRNYEVQYSDAWCAAFVSACSISAGLTDIVPVECGCEKMINLYKKLGCWIEDESVTPWPGDIIFYHWADDGTGDCTGEADHVGIVEACDGKDILVIEGNWSDCVMRKLIGVNAKCLRGFARPNWEDPTDPARSLEAVAQEVIDGDWNRLELRYAMLTVAGYDPEYVQSKVNEMLA